MSKRSFRSESRKTSGLRRRPPSNVSSPSHQATPNRRIPRPSTPVRILERCSSDPMICSPGISFSYDDRSVRSEVDDVFSGTNSLTDAFVSSPLLIAYSPRSFQGFEKEAKVVVNVTVEGSPGPVRTMVKLGSSVEDTIKLVLDKYCGEGRTPKLELDSTSSFELHHSYFSLQSLENSELIGDVGSRSFYLRRKRGKDDSHGYIRASSATTIQRTVPETTKISVLPPPSLPPPAVFLLPSLISIRIGKIIRRTRKLWKILVCFG